MDGEEENIQNINNQLPVSMISTTSSSSSGLSLDILQRKQEFDRSGNVLGAQPPPPPPPGSPPPKRKQVRGRGKSSGRSRRSKKGKNVVVSTNKNESSSSGSSSMKQFFDFEHVDHIVNSRSSSNNVDTICNDTQKEERNDRSSTNKSTTIYTSSSSFSSRKEERVVGTTPSRPCTPSRVPTTPRDKKGALSKLNNQMKDMDDYILSLQSKYGISAPTNSSATASTPRRSATPRSNISGTPRSVTTPRTRNHLSSSPSFEKERSKVVVPSCTPTSSNNRTANRNYGRTTNTYKQEKDTNDDENNNSSEEDDYYETREDDRQQRRQDKSFFKDSKSRRNRNTSSTTNPTKNSDSDNDDSPSIMCYISSESDADYEDLSTNKAKSKAPPTITSTIVTPLDDTDIMEDVAVVLPTKRITRKEGKVQPHPPEDTERMATCTTTSLDDKVELIGRKLSEREEVNEKVKDSDDSVVVHDRLSQQTEASTGDNTNNIDILTNNMSIPQSTPSNKQKKQQAKQKLKEQEEEETLIQSLEDEVWVKLHNMYVKGWIGVIAKSRTDFDKRDADRFTRKEEKREEREAITYPDDVMNKYLACHQTDEVEQCTDIPEDKVVVSPSDTILEETNTDNDTQKTSTTNEEAVLPNNVMNKYLACHQTDEVEQCTDTLEDKVVVSLSDTILEETNTDNDTQKTSITNEEAVTPNIYHKEEITGTTTNTNEEEVERLNNIMKEEDTSTQNEEDTSIQDEGATTNEFDIQFPSLDELMVDSASACTEEENKDTTVENNTDIYNNRMELQMHPQPQLLLSYDDDDEMNHVVDITFSSSIDSHNEEIEVGDIRDDQQEQEQVIEVTLSSYTASEEEEEDDDDVLSIPEEKQLHATTVSEDSIISTLVEESIMEEGKEVDVVHVSSYNAPEEEDDVFCIPEEKLQHTTTTSEDSIISATMEEPIMEEEEEVDDVHVSPSSEDSLISNTIEGPIMEEEKEVDDVNIPSFPTTVAHEQTQQTPLLSWDNLHHQVDDDTNQKNTPISLSIINETYGNLHINEKEAMEEEEHNDRVDTEANNETYDKSHINEKEAIEEEEHNDRVDTEPVTRIAQHEEKEPQNDKNAVVQISDNESQENDDCIVYKSLSITEGDGHNPFQEINGLLEELSILASPQHSHHNTHDRIDMSVDLESHCSSTSILETNEELTSIAAITTATGEQLYISEEQQQQQQQQQQPSSRLETENTFAPKQYLSSPISSDIIEQDTSISDITNHFETQLPSLFQKSTNGTTTNILPPLVQQKHNNKKSTIIDTMTTSSSICTPKGIHSTGGADTPSGSSVGSIMINRTLSIVSVLEDDDDDDYYYEDNEEGGGGGLSEQIELIMVVDDDTEYISSSPIHATDLTHTTNEDYNSNHQKLGDEEGYYEFHDDNDDDACTSSLPSDIITDSLIYKTLDSEKTQATQDGKKLSSPSKNHNMTDIIIDVSTSTDTDNYMDKYISEGNIEETSDSIIHNEEGVVNNSTCDQQIPSNIARTESKEGILLTVNTSSYDEQQQQPNNNALSTPSPQQQQLTTEELFKAIEQEIVTLNSCTAASSVDAQLKLQQRLTPQSSMSFIETSLEGTTFTFSTTCSANNDDVAIQSSCSSSLQHKGEGEDPPNDDIIRAFEREWRSLSNTPIMNMNHVIIPSGGASRSTRGWKSLSNTPHHNNSFIHSSSGNDDVVSSLKYDSRNNSLVLDNCDSEQEEPEYHEGSSAHQNEMYVATAVKQSLPKIYKFPMENNHKSNTYEQLEYNTSLPIAYSSELDNEIKTVVEGCSFSFCFQKEGQPLYHNTRGHEDEVVSTTDDDYNNLPKAEDTRNPARKDMYVNYSYSTRSNDEDDHTEVLASFNESSTHITAQTWTPSIINQQQSDYNTIQSSSSTSLVSYNRVRKTTEDTFKSFVKANIQKQICNTEALGCLYTNNQLSSDTDRYSCSFDEYSTAMITATKTDETHKSNEEDSDDAATTNLHHSNHTATTPKKEKKYNFDRLSVYGGDKVEIELVQKPVIVNGLVLPTVPIPKQCPLQTTEVQCLGESNGIVIATSQYTSKDDIPPLSLSSSDDMTKMSDDIERYNYYMRKAVRLVKDNYMAFDEVIAVLKSAKKEGLSFHSIMNVFEESLQEARNDDKQMSLLSSPRSIGPTSRSSSSVSSWSAGESYNNHNRYMQDSNNNNSEKEKKDVQLLHFYAKTAAALADNDGFTNDQMLKVIRGASKLDLPLDLELFLSYAANDPQDMNDEDNDSSCSSNSLRTRQRIDKFAVSETEEDDHDNDEVEYNNAIIETSSTLSVHSTTVEDEEQLDCDQSTTDSEISSSSRRTIQEETHEDLPCEENNASCITGVETRSIDETEGSIVPPKDEADDYFRALSNYSILPTDDDLSMFEDIFEERENRRVGHYNYINGLRKFEYVKLKAEKHGLSTPTSAALTAMYPQINGVESVTTLRLRRKQHHQVSKMQHKSISKFWKLPRKERIKLHPGFQNVDMEMFYELTEISDNYYDDSTSSPLNFIHTEQNHFERIDATDWLVTLKSEKKNKRCYLRPIYHPKSMVISINSSKIPKEWNEEWYMTWEARMNNPNNLIQACDGRQSKTSRDKKKKRGKQKLKLAHWRRNKHSKVLAEIGTICTVRVMQEHLSRVHYEYTSSLRSSTWRRKYGMEDIFGN